MLLSASRLAFYGKLPCAGDFIARNIDYAESWRLDDWLVNGFGAYKASTSLWLDNYLISPVWNFVVPSGVWLDEPVIGALMPSVDRVGRYFPFVFFMRLNRDILCAESQQELCNYFFKVEQIAEALPELLSVEIAVDEIIAFVDQLQSSTDSCSEGVEWDYLQTQIANGKSYWWCSSEKMERDFYCLVEDSAELFLRLFDQGNDDENKSVE